VRLPREFARDVATARRRLRSRRVAGAKWRSGLVEMVFIGSFLT
jgi:hypothetical protein